MDFDLKHWFYPHPRGITAHPITWGLLWTVAVGTFLHPIKERGRGNCTWTKTWPELPTIPATLVERSTGEAGHVGCQQPRTVTADTKITFLSSSQQRNIQSFNHVLKHTNDFVRKLVACRCCLRMVFSETTSLSKRNGRSAHSGKSDEARGGVV